MMLKNKLLLVAATAVFINSAAPVAQELEESFNCVGKASLKDEMPKDLNKEIKMLLTLLTPIEFTETFEIRDALIEGAKIEISDSKITLAKSFFKKIGKIDTNIHQMRENEFPRNRNLCGGTRKLHNIIKESIALHFFWLN